MRPLLDMITYVRYRVYCYSCCVFKSVRLSGMEEEQECGNKCKERGACGDRRGGIREGRVT